MPIRMYTILALTGRLEEVTAEEERQVEKVQETINQLSDRMEELQATKQDQATISFSRFFCCLSRFSDVITNSIGVFLFLLFKIFTWERGVLKGLSVDIVVFHQNLLRFHPVRLSARIPSRKSYQLILISH
jgi:hypothetical protein